MISKIINFAILFGGLFYFLRKPVMAMLTRRTQDIARTLDEARAARSEAESRLAEARAKVTALEAEMARLRTEAEAEGRRGKERIREMAGQEAERLRALAKLEVEAHLKAGVRDLKAYTADLAASLAEARIKARLTGADQSDLIDKSIAKLKTLHEESDPR
ncbi:MAG: ATP synthase F0 subunit B [Acidobacteriota bacterium]|nr:ATP synthase F0 subunit B [Acidobacteriota bacterium]